MTLPPHGQEPGGQAQHPYGDHAGRQQYRPYGGPIPGPPPGGSLYPAPRPTNGLAIASMVVSILSAIGALSLCGVGGIFGIVGAIMGHVARGQIRRGGSDGDGFALAGVIVGWVAFAIAVIAFIAVVGMLVWLGHVDTPYDTTFGGSSSSV